MDTRSMPRTALFVLALSLVPVAEKLRADWPQWRGPNRNGALDSSPPLVVDWPRSGPPLLWESEEIPPRGGYASPIVADGRVFLFVNDIRKKPIATRALDSRVFSRIRWFDPSMVPAELLASVEKERAMISPRLRGVERNRRIDAWIEANLPESIDRSVRKTLIDRLRSGERAVPVEVFTKIAPARGKVFESQEALDAWLTEQGIDGRARKEVDDAVTKTVDAAEDLVICVNAKSGETIWKSRLPGVPEERNASSTPALSDGKLFVSGSSHAHALDVASGEPIWSTALPKGGGPSSFVLVGGLAVAMADSVIALDAATGKIVWHQPAVRGRRSSPVVWEHGGESYILCNQDRRSLSCLSAKTGEVLWEVAGGSFATPLVAGDIAVVHVGGKEDGMIAYRMTPEGANRIWTVAGQGRGAASPLVHDDHVYVVGSDAVRCVELATGALKWEKTMRAEIASPVLADGKVFALTGNGGFLIVFDATPKEYVERAKVRVRAERCTSPALSDGRLFLRTQEGLRCFDLSGQVKP